MSIIAPQPLALAAIAIHSPTGPAWEFLVLFLVVIIGPPLLERARLPGIIGLLLGGYAIATNRLNLIGAWNTTVPALGQIGCASRAQGLNTTLIMPSCFFWNFS